MSGGAAGALACPMSQFDENVEPLVSYLERLELYFEASEVQEEKRTAVLLSLIGPKHYNVLRDSTAPEKPSSKSYSELVEMLKVPEPVEMAERYRFYQRNQKPSESVSEYMATLRKFAQYCNFGAFLDEALRDKLVCGVSDKDIQKRLLCERTLTLDSAMVIASAMDKHPMGSRLGGVSGVKMVLKKGPRMIHEKVCYKCGEPGHIKQDCPHKLVSCERCGRIGHITSKCHMNVRTMRSFRSRVGPGGQGDKGSTDSADHDTTNCEELGGRQRHPYNARPMNVPPKTARVPQNFDYFLVLDFEATCDERKTMNPQEILEFPVLKVNAETYDIEATFHHFVRPIKHPTLTEFCTRLLPITQDDVDNAEPFPEVFTAFDKWMQEEVGLDKKFLFVTCGDWDLKTMLPSQCETSDLQVPSYCKKWHNIKKAYALLTGQYNRGMMSMIHSLGLPHEGKHHSGLDDCQNIANILRALADRGCKFLATMSIE